jgi:hypothetical protein
MSKEIGMMREEMGRMWEDIEENEGGDEED